MWRPESGRAVRIAYRIYGGPNNRYGKAPCVLGCSEFGLEIVVTTAYLVSIHGLSFDKACLLLNFIQNLKPRKSQADALLRQLAGRWETEFEILCALLANAAVVHADETRWSLNNVWASISEEARCCSSGSTRTPTR